MKRIIFIFALFALQTFASSPKSKLEKRAVELVEDGRHHAQSPRYVPVSQKSPMSLSHENDESNKAINETVEQKMWRKYYESHQPMCVLPCFGRILKCFKCCPSLFYKM